MSTSFTYTEVVAFTVTHARHMAAKVATDLKRVQRFYCEPSDSSIAAYQEELTLLLKSGYLGTVTYGFQRGGEWIEPSLRYTGRELGMGNASDDDPGRIPISANTKGAVFKSYLTYSAAWDRLSDSEKQAFQKELPFQRSGAAEPGINGNLHSDRTYSAGGRALDRMIVRGSR